MGVVRAGELAREAVFRPLARGAVSAAQLDLLSRVGAGMCRLVLLTVLASALALLAPAGAAAQVAPGRVVFDLDGGRIVHSVDPFGPSIGVARPDGGVVLAGTDRGRGVRLVAVRADGSLDETFGDDGIARVSLPYTRGSIGAFPVQLLRRPDGRLILAYPGRCRGALSARAACARRADRPGAPRFVLR